MHFNELTMYQARSLVDLRQVFDAWSAARRETSGRYAGSMRWRRIDGGEYLVRKVGASETSLGPRSPETERLHQRFTAGRDAARERLDGLVKALDTQAAVARAVGLGRVPLLVARLLRVLADAKILGRLRIVGTTALFAYEALAGVRLSPEALATGDIDLLLDARHRLRLMVDDPESRTIIGLLRRLDHSFAIIPGARYRVVNKDGFMVDLIRPDSNPPWKNAEPLAPDDLEPSPIEGLQWLVNSPLVEALVIDQRGYPAPIVVPDPRTWTLHKAWLAKRVMRREEKKRRDAAQARMAWGLIAKHLPQYPLDEAFAARLPNPLRAEFDIMRSADPNADPGEWTPTEPDW